ncbi:MAG: hypothetical protein HOB73_08385 [Planctomycetaceae bacterium]|nr:hypothetical protein [Planctomycetaceae bacterium]
MTIMFHCLMCGENLTVDDAQSGQQTECSKCGAEVLVPAASASSSAPVLRRGVSAGGVRSSSAKSVFRGKRKAQNRAEAAGEEFDGSDFEGQSLWKMFIAFGVSVLVVFLVYVGYLAIPPSRVLLTDAEATAIMRDVQSTNWGTYLGGQCDAIDKINDVIAYVRNETTYEEVFFDLKKLNDIIHLQAIAKPEDMEGMELMLVSKMMSNRQMAGNHHMLKHLERLRDSNPKLLQRMIKDISVFKAVIQTGP